MLCRHDAGILHDFLSAVRVMCDGLGIQCACDRFGAVDGGYKFGRIFAVGSLKSGHTGSMSGLVPVTPFAATATRGWDSLGTSAVFGLVCRGKPDRPHLLAVFALGAERSHQGAEARGMTELCVMGFISLKTMTHGSRPLLVSGPFAMTDAFP